MNSNEKAIHSFYTAFAKKDSAKMAEYYHEKIRFQDPVFNVLRSKDAMYMWEMLIERSKGNLKINFSNIKTIENTVHAKWIATYNFSLTNRKIKNIIHAEFEFKDGLIIRHTDNFNFWKWNQQAFGFKGYLLGWTGYMQNKIKKEARKSLQKYKAKKRFLNRQSELINPEILPINSEITGSSGLA